MNTGDVLAQWFAAHAGGDHDAARALLSEGAPIGVPGARLAGFDDLMSWYARRAAAEGPDFSYTVIDVLTGERHAAALLAMRNGARQWRQLAVYTIEAGMITAIWAVEDDG